MWQDHIEYKGGILAGKPIIKGTRIGVDLILEKIGNRETVEKLLLAYPGFRRKMS